MNCICDDGEDPVHESYCAQFLLSTGEVQGFVGLKLGVWLELGLGLG